MYIKFMLVVSEVGPLLESKVDPSTGMLEEPVNGTIAALRITKSKFLDLYLPCTYDFREVVARFPSVITLKAKVTSNNLRENSFRISHILKARFWKGAFGNHEEPKQFSEFNARLVEYINTVKPSFTNLATEMRQALRGRTLIRTSYPTGTVVENINTAMQPVPIRKLYLCHHHVPLRCSSIAIETEDVSIRSVDFVEYELDQYLLSSHKLQQQLLPVDDYVEIMKKVRHRILKDKFLEVDFVITFKILMNYAETDELIDRKMYSDYIKENSTTVILDEFERVHSCKLCAEHMQGVMDIMRHFIVHHFKSVRCTFKENKSSLVCHQAFRAPEDFLTHFVLDHLMAKIITAIEQGM